MLMIPEREDAYRNHQVLLAAARETFVELGVGAPMREVAERAGVGVGVATLYRHFPTREALVRPLVLDDVHWLLRHGAAALPSVIPPDEALHEWLAQLTRISMTFAGLPRMVMAAFHDEESPLASTCAALRSTAERLLVRAVEAKLVRPEVTVDELLALSIGAAWVAEHTSPRPRSAAGLVSIMWNGFAAVPGGGTRP